MSKSKWLAVVAAALVAGLVLGNLGSAVAAENTSTATPSTLASCGLGIGRELRDAGGRMIDIVADLTGLSVDDIRAQRQDGKSLGQIAEDEGVSSDKVVDEALAVRKAALDQAVKDGQITQAQADEAFERMQARLTDRVDNTATGRGGAGCGGGGVGGGRGGGVGGGTCGGGGCGGAGAPVVTQ